MITELTERDFTAEQRKAAAKSGAAMSDGRFPIENKSDLENAIRAVGRASDPAAAKAHIKKRAKALGATDLLPDTWMQESCSPDVRRALVGSVVPLQEAAYDAPKGLLTLTIIKPGFSLNKLKFNGTEAQRYYPASMLKKSAHVFEGAKMYADHATDAENRAYPSGSVKNWVGSVRKVWAESDGTIRAESAVIDPQFKAKLEELNKQGMLGEMGISVRATAEVADGKAEGKEAKIIESLISARSVDFVTVAAAGGRVEMMESFIQEDANDLDLVTETELRSRRPDLVELIESHTQRSTSTMHKTLEEQLQEATTKLADESKARTEAETKAKKLQETVDVGTEQLKTLTLKFEESEKASKKATVSVELAKLLSESKLPEQAQAKLKKQFSEALVVDGMKEAIESEKEYIKSFASETKVRNMGRSHNGTQVSESAEKDTRADLKESFMSIGMSEKDAEIAAAGRQPMKIVQTADVASR